jgi:hypothetical protein
MDPPPSVNGNRSLNNTNRPLIRRRQRNIVKEALIVDDEFNVELFRMKRCWQINDFEMSSIIFQMLIDH